jgi:septal ring factor EnvC (AmiA/AmiB activator)
MNFFEYIRSIKLSVFKEEVEYKRIIFNIELPLAERLEKAKDNSKSLGKKLDFDNTINKALEKFLKKAEKKIDEIKRKREESPPANSDESNPTHADSSLINEENLERSPSS